LAGFGTRGLHFACRLQCRFDALGYAGARNRKTHFFGSFQRQRFIQDPRKPRVIWHHGGDSPLGQTAFVFAENTHLGVVGRKDDINLFTRADFLDAPDMALLVACYRTDGARRQSRRAVGHPVALLTYRDQTDMPSIAGRSCRRRSSR
jgi:hypothetical protein